MAPAGIPVAVQGGALGRQGWEDRPAGGTPGAVHQARELLSCVAMLTQCLDLPDVSEAEWRQWPPEITEANRRLEELFAGGLSRSFRGEPTWSHRHLLEAGTA